MEKIEEMGYDKIYVKNCLDNNVLCQATAIYFLLINYDNIKKKKRNNSKYDDDDDLTMEHDNVHRSKCC